MYCQRAAIWWRVSNRACKYQRWYQVGTTINTNVNTNVAKLCYLYTH